MDLVGLQNYFLKLSSLSEPALVQAGVSREESPCLRPFPLVLNASSLSKGKTSQIVLLQTQLCEVSRENK